MSTTVSASPVAEQAVRNALLGVIDPELGDNIVDLGMVQRIDIDSQSGDVGVTVALTTSGCPMRGQLMKDVKRRVVAIPGVGDVQVHFGEMTTEQNRGHCLGQGRGRQIFNHRQLGRSIGRPRTHHRSTRR